ncbi:MAG: serine hydrolase domain-containing protein [Gammaproteobacteria bacterium]
MKSLLTIIKYLLLTLFLLITGGFAVMYSLDPVVTTRIAQVPFKGIVGPRERVPGGKPIEIPASTSAAISQAVVDQAVAYGEETGSHALIIFRDDGIEVEKYYPGYNADSISQTQSMHKSVLALLVGLAIEDGYIGSIDDSAALYLPEWSGDDRAKITIRQMLRQTSGIDFATVGINPLGGFYQLMLGADVSAAALELPLDVEPGTQFDYNSAIPQNMGLIIQRATGQRYARYLSQALWQHIGAPDAFVVLDSDEKSMPRTSCCLDATARSWLHIGLLHLDEGQIGGRQVVPAEWISDVATPGDINPNYGYFTWLGSEYEQFRRYNRKTSVRVFHSEPYVAEDVIYFDGFGGQRVYIIPSFRLVIVRTGDTSQSWDDAYLPNLIVRDLIKNAPDPTRESD